MTVLSIYEEILIHHLFCRMTMELEAILLGLVIYFLLIGIGKYLLSLNSTCVAATKLR